MPFDASYLHPSFSGTLSFYCGYAMFERVSLDIGMMTTYAYLPEEVFRHNLSLTGFIRFRFLLFNLGIGCDFLQVRAGRAEPDMSLRVNAGLVIPLKI